MWKVKTCFKSVRGGVLEFHPMWLEPRGVDCKQALRNIEKQGLSLHYYGIDAPRYDIEQFTNDHHLFWLKSNSA